MLFLADMGISPNTVKWLRENNHDAIHLMDENLYRAPDPFILEKARKENRVIITSDLDFGQLMAASGNKFPSVIILRLNLGNSKNQIHKISNVINEAGLSLLNGAVISVTDSSFRIRLTPINKNQQI